MNSPDCGVVSCVVPRLEEVSVSVACWWVQREQMAEREAVLRHKKEFMMMRQHNDVRQMLERQKRGHYSNFQEMVQVRPPPAWGASMFGNESI